MSSENEIWREHLSAWRHCLRCRVAQNRLCRDKERGLRPSYVPPAVKLNAMSPKVPDAPPRGDVVFLLSAPDADQAWFSSLVGDPSQGEMSPQTMALRHVLGVAEELGCLPLEESEIVLVSAMGCRPFSLKDGRKLVKPNASALKACRPRWETEILLAQPRLIVAFGPHAFGALGIASAKSYNACRGEVLEAKLGPKGGPQRSVPVYIGPDPYRALLMARRDEWSTVLSVAPPISAARFPVADLLWHTVFPLWLVAIERHLAGGGSFGDLPGRMRSGWSMMLSALESYAISKESVGEVVADLLRYVEEVREQELSEDGRDVRTFMIAPVELQVRMVPSLLTKRREDPDERGVILEEDEDDEDDEGEAGDEGAENEEEET